MHEVSLKSVKIFAYHGMFPQETVLGNWYEVDVAVKADFSKTAQTDDLSNGVDYQKLYEIIKSVMTSPKQLLETVLEIIFSDIIKVYPSVQSVEIKLRKLNPPVGGQVAYSQVSLYKEQVKGLWN